MWRGLQARRLKSVSPNNHGKLLAMMTADPLPRPAAPSATAIREQLARLTASSALANAERLSSLLRFVVEETLSGRRSQLKEARIGLEVFGRKADLYDPAIDPIVRVQMGRLRTNFAPYYSAQGAADLVRIDIPVGATWRRSRPRRRPRADREPTPAAADDLRIAVLPIVNMSPERENQYFCDGLTEELINRLAQIRQLRVVARTSSFQFKDAARDIREIGRLLDVSTVLEGSVRKSGIESGSPSAHQRSRWLSLMVGAVRARSERHLRDSREYLDGGAASAAEKCSARIGARQVAPAGHRRVQPVPAGAFPLEEENRRGT